MTVHRRRSAPSAIADCVRALSGVTATVRARLDRGTPSQGPVIDVHCHLNSAFAYRWQRRSADQIVAALDRAGVSTIVDLDGGFGDALSAEIDRVHMPYPQRIVVFAGIDTDALGHGNTFGDVEAARLEDSVRRGAMGLKITKTLGLGAVDQRGRLIAIDDTRLAPLWDTAGALGVPVLIHVADPPAFFEPLDPRNERWEELSRQPEWHYAPIRATPEGAGFPSHAELLDQFEAMIDRHRGTTFIAAHLASCGDRLDRLATMLGRYPHLNVDISARINELGRQPDVARRFLETFRDRVLFGTDQGPDPRWYPVYFRFLETSTKAMNYSIYHRPVQGNWRVDGLALPNEVLAAIYHGNADRLIRFGPRS